jgi:DNA-binding HxlR family transcriptional regulator
MTKAVKNPKSYGQFCPVARAAEVVAERWTPLIVRELLMGSHRFSALRRGVPLISPSLLSRRLIELEDAGVIERRGGSEGRNAEYHLTAAGEALRPVIEMLGVWGHQWLRHKLTQEELDPSLLMWDVRRRVDATKLPPSRRERTVVCFELRGVPSKQSRYWLVFDRGEVDLCLKHPGHEHDLSVASHIRDLTRVWLGTLGIGNALREDRLQLSGDRALARSFPRWFGLSSFAQVPQLPAVVSA